MKKLGSLYGADLLLDTDDTKTFEAASSYLDELAKERAKKFDRETELSLSGIKKTATQPVEKVDKKYVGPAPLWQRMIVLAIVIIILGFLSIS